jgi:hypothetical protein
MHLLLIARRAIVIDIPVANGNMMASLIDDSPNTFCIMFNIIDLVNLTIKLEPIALGYKALTSPDLPIP